MISKTKYYLTVKINKYLIVFETIMVGFEHQSQLFRNFLKIFNYKSIIKNNIIQRFD